MYALTASTFTPRSSAALFARASNKPSRSSLISSPLIVRAFREDEPRTGRNKPYEVKGGDAIVIPAFTRRREREVGRIASLGVAAMFWGEVLTGLGPLTQLSAETGVPMQLVYASTAFLAASQLVLGLFKGSPTFDKDNQRDVNKRSKGLTGISAIEPDTDERIKPTQEPGKFFLRNELTLGRLAMLIFAGAAIAESMWGGESPLAHLGLIQPGVPLSQAPIWLNASAILFLINGLGVLSGFNSRKDADTY